MTHAYLLAGENMDLAEAELEGFLNSQEIGEEPERKKRLAFTDEEPGQLRRLALVHEVAKVIERSTELETDYRPENSFAVRAEAIDTDEDIPAIEEELGEKLSTENNTVDLETPEEVVRVYIFEDEYVIARQILDIDRGLFENRKNQNRPFSSPISLDPVLARVMVNLAGVSAGEHVLDPFCGTGGILIEAGLCGIGVHGLDIQEKMVEGTRENLEEYGIIAHDIKEGEIGEVSHSFEEKFDAVITDLPYGKASKEKGDTVKQFLEAIPGMSDKTVFMSNSENVDGLSPEFEVYIHKNLTRYLYIL